MVVRYILVQFLLLDNMDKVLRHYVGRCTVHLSGGSFIFKGVLQYVGDKALPLFLKADDF